MEFEHYIFKGFIATRWDESVIGFVLLRAIDLAGNAVSDVGFKLLPQVAHANDLAHPVARPPVSVMILAVMSELEDFVFNGSS